MAGPTHYEVLGVPAGASAEDIRSAYRSAARRLHPDVAPGGRPPEAMQQLNAAWHVLSDPGRRAAYDRSLVEGTVDDEAAARPAPPAGDPPDRSAEWAEVYADLLDTDPIGPIRTPEGWWAVAPPAMLLLGIGLGLVAFVVSSPGLFVFSGAALFFALGLFILAPLRAMTRPRQ